ncbi:MAG: amidohydrolase family protein [Pirellulales bacterium]
MTTYRARYVFPVDRPPIENGTVTIEGGYIRAVGRFPDESDATDLGDVAIIPGLVNAHTHLEFSDLERPLGEPGMSLPWWIREVIKHRTNVADVLSPSAAVSPTKRDPIQMGIDESARCGVVTIGEIATGSTFKGSPLDVSRYFELRALRRGDVDRCLDEAKSVLSQCDGLSPHAPYTVHRDLFEAAIWLCRYASRPLVMHLAESPEELQLLATARGPMRDLLDERNWWEPGAILVGQKPIDYLQQLSNVPRSIIIHGNYLDDDELRFLGIYRDRMSVVYCPRTHAYFRHDPYPLRSMLSHRLVVALGTDSRASNPDLDVRKEMQFVIERHGVSPELALRLGTINGAAAMGLGEYCGILTVGKSANLAIVQIPLRHSADPHELLFDAEARVIATMSRGRVVFSEHPTLAP